MLARKTKKIKEGTEVKVSGNWKEARDFDIAYTEKGWNIPRETVSRTMEGTSGDKHIQRAALDRTPQAILGSAQGRFWTMKHIFFRKSDIHIG